MQKKHIVLQGLQHPQKSPIILRHHNTEPHKLSIQALEGGTVSDHQALFDAGFEDVVGSQSVFLDFEEDEVCVSWINLIGVYILQLLDHPVTFGENQISCFFDIIFILEHDLSCKSTKAVEGPWSLLLAHF